jgi:D-amino-acid dehydrogenase
MSDVAVIGGGIVGSSVAYHAARAGLRVTLVDRADEGYATAAGAGIIATGVGSPQDSAYNTLAAQAAAFYPRLIAGLADDGEAETGYDVVGALLIARDEAEVAALAETQRFAEASRAAGVHGIDGLSLLDGRQAWTLFPALAEIPAALHIAGTARIDGRLMRAALQRAARKHGVTSRQGNTTLQRDGSSARVLVDGAVVPADAIVLATGAWSAQAGEALGLTLPVYPQRGQIAHLELPHVDTSRWPVVLPFASHYLLTFPTNRVVVGATRENDAGFDCRITAGGVQQVLAQALRVAPGLHGATLREMRVGFRPATPDGLPILGRAPGLDNVFIATGHGPAGLTLGPHAGAIIAELMQGHPPEFDLAPYAPARFQGVPHPA